MTTAAAGPSKAIDGKGRKVRELLSRTKYSIDYYQRAYKWQKKQVTEHYLKQNLLAQSLHEDAYDHSPGLKRFTKESGLKFEPHAHLKKADFDDRQDLYINLAQRICDPARLDEEAAR
jgi:uncharacterized protein with ParB-like and HNH nuclease domain